MAYRSSSSATNAAIVALGTIDPGLPAGTISGDVLVAVVTTTPLAYDVTAPAGWTQIYAGVSTGVYRADGSVSSTVFTRGASLTKGVSIGISAFSGRNSASPITASSFQDNVSTGGATAFAVGTPVTSALADDVLAAYVTQFPTTGSAPAGYADVVQFAAANPYLDVATTSNVSAGSTGTLQHAVTSAYGTDSVVVLSLAAAPTGPTVTSVSSKRFNSSRHNFGLSR